MFGADDAVLGGFNVPTCPAYLMPGERGTFEVFAPLSVGGVPPFRIEVGNQIGGFTGPMPETPPPYRPEGLGVVLLSKDATQNLLVAEVSNDSVSTYAFVDMCANLRDRAGRLLEVARVDHFGMPIIELAPGERRTFPLFFNDLPEGEIDFVARGSVNHKSGTPRLALKDLTILQRQEVVDDSGQRILRIVGEIDVSAYRDIGGLRLSAHVEGDYLERVDGVRAGCGSYADAALPAPVQFAIPLDRPATLRKLVVETILGTPGQDLHRLTAAEVRHRSQTGDSQLVTASIVNSFDTRARLLGVCLMLRNRHGELVGVTSLAPVQFLAPGESVRVSGEVVALGKVWSAEVIAFAHVLPTP